MAPGWKGALLYVRGFETHGRGRKDRAYVRGRDSQSALRSADSRQKEFRLSSLRLRRCSGWEAVSSQQRLDHYGKFSPRADHRGVPLAGCAESLTATEPPFGIMRPAPPSQKPYAHA